MNLKKPVVNKKNAIKYLSLALVVLFTIFLDTNTNNIKASDSSLVYKVFLDEELIGVVKDVSFINEYMDTKKDEYSSSYGIKKIYTPEDLVIVPEYHMNATLTSENYVLQRIKENAKFKVDGYIVEIERQIYKEVEGSSDLSDIEKETVVEQMSVLSIDEFEKSLESFIKLFVKEDEYNRIMNKEQAPEMVEEERLLIDFYLDANIRVYESQVEVSEVLKSEDEIIRYLLYKTRDIDELDNTYVVKQGDTIRKIANENRLTINELILINDSIKSENTLLTPDQVLFINEPKPMLSVVTEEYLVTREPISFNTIYQEDPSRYTYQHDYVKVKGVLGERRVKYSITSINGESLQGYTEIDAEVTAEPITQIVLEGTKVSTQVGIGTMHWPTASRTVSAGYGWYYPWGIKMWHKGTDIIGRVGDTIRAIDNGIVIAAKFDNISGWYVTIDHNNGFISTYAHMNSRPYVNKGDTVNRDAPIGALGGTGMVTGPHLHLEVKLNGGHVNPEIYVRKWW